MQAHYLQHKRETLESFLRFAEGQGFPQWPVEVFIEVSNICDLQCAMCQTFSALNPERYFALRREDRGVIAYETATEPLETILEHALIIHASGYGEPTIHPQYREVLAYLARYEALIDFFTNGMHLDEDFCRFLVASRIHRVAVSFSGVTAEAYENIYIGGDYERVLAGIRCLRQCRDAAGSRYPRIEINSLAFRHHIEQLPAFVRLMAEAGADVVHVKQLHYFAEKMPELRHHQSHMHPDVEGRIVEEARAVAKACGIHLACAPYEATQKHALNYTRAFDAMPSEEREALFARVEQERLPVRQIKAAALSAGKRDEKKQVLEQRGEMRARQAFDMADNNFIQHNGAPCLEPFKTFHAAFDGRVRTCCFSSSQDYIGHLSQHSGEAIWQGAAYQRLREQAVRNRYQQDMCGKCLKKNNYPKQHDIQAEFNSYRRWLAETAAAGQLDDLCNGIQAVPSPGVILQRQRSERTP